jgi:hypothetical protein
MALTLVQLTSLLHPQLSHSLSVESLTDIFVIRRAGRLMGCVAIGMWVDVDGQDWFVDLWTHGCYQRAMGVGENGRRGRYSFT